MFRPQVNRKALSLDLSLSPKVAGWVRGDAGSLRQVLINLVGNAVKFTNQGRIGIAALPGETHTTSKRRPVLFHITDTGIGIKPENRERIFSMFEQEDASMTKCFGGAGLGLAISKKLVEQMGGSICVESVPGVGSRFSFTVEFDEAAPHFPNAAACQALALPTPETRILIVEDDAFNLKFLMQALEGSGYRVECAQDGASALSMLSGMRFDLVLMDIQLPVMSGIEATHLIRSNAVEGCDPNIPIIAVTAYALRGDSERFLEEGLTDYISKPIDATKLLTTIGRVLAQRQTVRGPGLAGSTPP